MVGFLKTGGLHWNTTIATHQLRVVFMSAEEDRRRAPRSPISDTLFIQSVSSSQVSPLDDATCSTVNASATGLQVELDFEVLENAQIALWISRDDGNRTLMSGIIRWTRPTSRSTFLVGIELDAESTPAVSQWLGHSR